MKKIKIIIIILGLFSLVAFFWWNRGIGPADQNNQNAQTFTIQKGAGLREIASNLKEANLISDPTVFFLLVKTKQIDKKIQHGNFRLSPAMDALTIAENLTHGTTDIIVTIPEGKRAEEIAEILQKNIPTYDESWLTQLIEKEGYLFPDTYYIHPDANIDAILTQMLNNFDAKYTEAVTGSQTAYTQEELVIIASLIEREARLPEERPLISSVLENRLNEPMRLQIDATVQYAVGYSQAERSWWKKNLTVQDLGSPSPYNTYTNDGLPPTPIANPGIESLRAAANPTKTNYLFYMTDKNGVTHFARTNDEHNANISKYGL